LEGPSMPMIEAKVDLLMFTLIFNF
jgi:hypothetical protein